MDNKDYLLIIDGSSLLTTQFFGNLPKEILFEKDPEKKKTFYHKIMQNTKGVYTNAVFGFMRTLFSIIDNQCPKYLAVTWDVTRNTFRRELYEDYKANRSETMEPLKNQFILMQEVLERIGVKQFMSERYEADDFSGSLASRFSGEIPVVIMTKDHDYLQLVNDNVALWLIASDQKKANDYFTKYGLKKDDYNVPEKVIYMDYDHVEKEFGVLPESIPSLKGLQGDVSDNIKGVPGIGEKTAVALISHYKTISALYDEIKSVGDEKVLKEKWKTELGIGRNPLPYLVKESEEELVGEKAARLSETLATIKSDIPLSEELSDLTLELNNSEILKVFAELEINALKLPKSSSESGTADPFVTKYKEGLKEVFDIGEFLSVKEELLGKCAGNPVGLSVVIREGEPESLGICLGSESTAFISSGFLYPALLSELAADVADRASFIASDDYKLLLSILDEEPKVPFFDMGVAHYLYNPLETKHDAKAVCMACGTELSEDIQSVAFAAYTALNKQEALLDLLSAGGLSDLYENIEKPLIPVLSSMEKAGIRCQASELDRQGEELGSALKKIEEEIYELAGEKFNILSPKQLGVILFEKLGLKAGKKTKSGYSTNADVLEKLAPESLIVQKVLDYRTLSKLISTYVEGLKSVIAEDGRIHPTFNQTITNTGRLSCTEPNLQNIPVREELGRKIRKAFVPADGCVFVDADYSQIELRIMAHLSGDKRLTEDYKNARDIHRATAANVFHVPFDEVTPAQRRSAKAVNFGIIYGISSFGLGQDLDITRTEAKEYINTYFKEYPGVKKYLDRCVKQAGEKGYATSLYGRKRPLPELDSTNFMTRNFGERVAMNMPVQGTAADIMKIAMIKVYDALKASGLKARMLLQIHDEILIEAPEGEADAVKELLIQNMVAAASLNVPLTVDSNTANNWYELK
ncbi:MAG: DNA polymerase I [Lachnospiraceae bacterium]|nr:DNA polymerase I [Lachnospiraceae bacterium]